jgi:hypothetical protein
MIPKLIWCFWNTDDLPLSVNKSILSWKLHNPDYKITIINKRNIKEIIPDIDFSKIKHAKTSFQILSDFIRINVLRTYGGIWVDASTFSTMSYDKWFEKIGVTSKTEYIGFYNPEFTKKKMIKKSPVIENWFFACSKNSTFIKKWCDEFMKLKQYKSVHDYLNDKISDGIDFQNIDGPDYLTQHVSAQTVLQSGYSTENMIILNAVRNKYGPGPLYYLMSNKSIQMGEKKCVNLLCSDMKYWSFPIVKFTGSTRDILDKNTKIRNCVFDNLDKIMTNTIPKWTKSKKKVQRNKRVKTKKKVRKKRK